MVDIEHDGKQDQRQDYSRGARRFARATSEANESASSTSGAAYIGFLLGLCTAYIIHFIASIYMDTFIQFFNYQLAMAYLRSRFFNNDQTTVEK